MGVLAKDSQIGNGRTTNHYLVEKVFEPVVRKDLSTVGTSMHTKKRLELLEKGRRDLRDQPTLQKHA